MLGVATRGLRLAFLAILLLVVVILFAEILLTQRVQYPFGAGIRPYKQTVLVASERNTFFQLSVKNLTHRHLVPFPLTLVDSYLHFVNAGGRVVNIPLPWAMLTTTDENQKGVVRLHGLALQSVPGIVSAIAMVRNGASFLLEMMIPAQLMTLQQVGLPRIEGGINSYLVQLERLGRREQEGESPRWYLDVLVGGVLLLVMAAVIQLVVRQMRAQQQLLAEEIAKRKRLEEEVESRIEARTRKLKARNEHLYEAQRVARMGCWDWDLQSGVMDWSYELYAILGLDMKSVPASLETLLEQVHPDDREGIERVMLEMVEQGIPIDIDFRLYHDGAERVVQNRMVVEHRDDKGKPTYLLGTLQDITERKRVEEQLRLAASVFAHTGDGVMITDSNNQIIEINQAFTRILGYSAADVSGQDPSLLKSPRHRRSFYRSMWQSLQKNGQWQGEIWDKHKSGDIVPLWMTINAVYDERSRLRHYVALFRDISEVKRNEQTLWHIAHHDPLTGLPNRNLMYDRLRVAMSEAAREDLQVALLLIDLDGFKRINDEMGHDAGDELLIHVAQSLSESVRESDTVARYAGDEFIAVIKGLHEREDVGSLAHKLIDVLMQPQQLKGNRVIVGASIGIALYPAHATDAGELIAKADEAMYQAKRLGKGRSCFFGDDCDD